RIDVFDCTPSQLALIEGARGPEDEAFPQVTLVGGEAIGEGMWSELASASSRTYYNVYGPTECTVDATLGGCIGRGIWRVGVRTGAWSIWVETTSR
ncbi:hypothetical protein, partial [Burkholderia pseudomallei]|uniref:hypothetical protein n=1 Tax=Burkholderia pseudomallei TaxID=28450 RepID=UPI0035C7B0CB